MYRYPADIYTEPEPDTDTLANLGPLTGMAGIWTSADGMDVNPKADGPEHHPTSSATSSSRSTRRPTGRSSSTACAITPTS